MDLSTFASNLDCYSFRLQSMDKEKSTGAMPEEDGHKAMNIVNVTRNGNDGQGDAPADSSESEEQDDMQVFEPMESDDDTTIKVRIGNFVVIKDLDKSNPYITAFAISRNWYVGFAIDLSAYAYLNSVLFSEEKPTEDDLGGVYYFLTGIMAATTTLDAKLTDKIIKHINNAE